jgi:iron-sulfur cluster insertion protein
MSIGQDQSITVSAEAAAQIARIIASEGEAKMLRVSVSGGGCSGFQYGFDLVDQKNDDDLAIERNGITVLVDSISQNYMEGSEIHFADDLIGAAFQIRNPNAQSECGCGNSFSL